MESARTGKLSSLAGMLAGVCLLFCGFVFGQDRSISGTIKDAAGSAIAGARVTITNVETKVSQRVISNESGIYSASNLTSGAYRVTATKEGFAPDASSNVIEVRPGHAAVADVSLKMLASGNPTRDESFLQLSPGLTGDTFSGGAKGLRVAESDREDDDFLQLSPGIAGQGFASGVRCGFHPSAYMGLEGAGSKRTDEPLPRQSPPATGNSSPARPSGGPEAAGAQSHDETFLQLSPGVTGNAFSGWNNPSTDPMRDDMSAQPKPDHVTTQGALDESFLQLSPGVTGNAFSGWNNAGAGDDSFLQLSTGVTGNGVSGSSNGGRDAIRDTNLVSVSPAQSANMKSKPQQDDAKTPSGPANK
jgi:hypothetical protein